MRARFLTLTTVCLALVAAPSAAQRGPAVGRGADRIGSSPGGSGMELGRSVEAALRQRERLELSEEQVGELEALREGLIAALDPVREEAAAMRSEVREKATSPAERQELRRDRMSRQRALRARLDTITASFQARFEQVLPPLTRRELSHANPRPVGARARGAVRGGAREGARSVPARRFRAPDGRRPAPAFRARGLEGRGRTRLGLGIR